MDRKSWRLIALQFLDLRADIVDIIASIGQSISNIFCPSRPPNTAGGDPIPNYPPGELRVKQPVQPVRRQLSYAEGLALKNHVEMQEAAIQQQQKMMEKQKAEFDAAQMKAWRLAENERAAAERASRVMPMINDLQKKQNESFAFLPPLKFG